MIGYLKGIIKTRRDQQLLIEVAGVGYWVQTGSWQPNLEVECFIHQHIREDTNELFGFSSLDNLELFEQLISISGIGPKAGLSLLSLGSPNDLRQAILQENLIYLSRAPGIGQKAAQKIILELKEKLSLSFPAAINLENKHSRDLFSALEMLGYRLGDIQPIIQNIPKDLTELEAQMKWALQKLNH